ncbi:MAG: polysaccharide biosynthesis/export family protein [Janthinobacterium lividum]
MSFEFSPRAGLPIGRRGLIGGSVLLLAGCNPGRDLVPLPDTKPSSYRLGGGDVIRAIVFGEDQLTGEFRVDDQGQVAVPLLGSVRAAGLTPDQLSGQLTQALKSRNILRNPSVVIEVVSYRPVFVLGEVAKPGQYAFQPGMTMLTAVAIAGGFTYRAVRDYGSVVRTTNNDAVVGKAFPSSFLAPGDVVNVFERLF